MYDATFANHVIDIVYEEMSKLPPSWRLTHSTLKEKIETVNAILTCVEENSLFVSFSSKDWRELLDILFKPILHDLYGKRSRSSLITKLLTETASTCVKLVSLYGKNLSPSVVKYFYEMLLEVSDALGSIPKLKFFEALYSLLKLECDAALTQPIWIRILTLCKNMFIEGSASSSSSRGYFSR